MPLFALQRQRPFLDEKPLCSHEAACNTGMAPGGPDRHFCLQGQSGGNLTVPHVLLITDRASGVKFQRA